ncbi:MAG: hypothetical protein DSY42_00145 [Aquifex sp.]|nr:MAG: hypothetical protein DSY42_00145 [Aquifex sp.]
MERFLNEIGTSPVKISEKPEAYSLKLSDVSQTVEIIKYLILEHSKDVKLRELVAKIIKPCPSKAFECYIRRIVDYVRRNVKYVYDPPRLETIQSPKRTLILGMGDCDDHTVLVGTLLRIAGFPIKIVLGDINHDGKFEHVFIKAKVKDRWITVDTTAKEPFKEKPYPIEEIDLFEEEEYSFYGEVGFSLKDLPLIGRFFQKKEQKEREETFFKVVIPAVAIFGIAYLFTRLK